MLAAKAPKDHVRFDVSVATADRFMELIKDKSEFYRWGLLLSVPVEGDGSFNQDKDRLANGEEAMKVSITKKVNLLTQWTKVSTARCQQFAQWYYGADAILLTDVFEADPAQRTVAQLNVNEDNNKGLVRRYKIQLRILDQLILHVLRNHLTTSTYKSFLAHKHDFSFIDEVTGNEILSGLVLMRKMLDVCKPETIVEVRHLETDLDTIVLWPTHENNVRSLTTRMMTLLQEIHAKTGKHSYTDQRFITNLFRALESSPTEKFLSFVDQLKSQWIMEDISLPSDIILKLDKMHRNMVADGSWVNTNEKDTKVVALTTAIQDVKKKYGELAKKVSFEGGTKGGSAGAKGKGSSARPKPQTKTRCPEWQVTKKGNTIEHDGRKYVWCTRHTSKDGSINGLYMPSPHDHDEWAKKKADRTAAFKKRKEAYKKSGAKQVTPPAKKAKPDDEGLKLALGNKFASAMVTHCHMGQAEAENMFDSIYKHTAKGIQEN